MSGAASKKRDKTTLRLEQVHICPMLEPGMTHDDASHHRTCITTPNRSIRPPCVRTAFARMFRARQNITFGGLRAAMHDLLSDA